MPKSGSTDRWLDYECAVYDCSSRPESGAPVPLCEHHVRVTFAYVLARAEDVGVAPDPVTAAVVPEPEGYVYFIRKDDLIKIGYSTYPKVRFKALRPDEVLKVIAGSIQDERRCHAAFAHLREHGEYFRPGQDLLKFIEELPDQS